jgi:NAD+ synthase (glutamine-hydrolysing)
MAPVDPIRPLTIAICQFAPRKGDVAANLARLGRLTADATAVTPAPQVLLFPETATSGYFVEGAVRDVALTAGGLATELDEAYRQACAADGRAPVTVDVIVGFYERWQETLYNSAAYVTIGLPDGPPRLRHLHRKNFLPTYSLFDEERFVERGTSLRAFETPWGRAALLICEDAWHSLAGTLVALDGAQVVFVVSAAPARGLQARDDGGPGPASVARWERLMRDIADEQGVFTCYANLVGTEGGKRFFGGSLVVGPAGDVRARAPIWEEHLVVATLDLDDLVRARSDAPLLADLRVALPHLLEELRAIRAREVTPLAWDGPEPAAADLLRDARGELTGEWAVPADLLPDATPTTATPAGDPPARPAEPVAGALGLTVVGLRDHGGPPSLAIDPAITTDWLTGFLREEFARRGFSRAVLGLSGGLDSAVVAALAARALGPGRVLAVRLPYRTSSEDSLAHAQLVIDAFGLDARTLDISAAVDGYLTHEPDADATRRGNVMARLRMTALFDLAARYHALPLGTGNKTERLLGYFTWHGDDAPPVNPIGDLFKTQVRALAPHLRIPAVIIDKAPTADLVAGQTDEGDLGITYAAADEILHWLLHGYSTEALAAHGFRRDAIRQVRRRLDHTHWKRRGPSVALVSNTAIGESYLRPVDY